MEPVLLATFDLTTKFINEPNAHLWLSRYQEDDVPALFFTTEDKQQVSVASVNLAGYGAYPEEGNVFIKDWGENSGILAALLEAGVVSKPIQVVAAGFSEAAECELLIK